MEISVCCTCAQSTPPVSTELDFRPISQTSIATKVFESIVVKWVDDSLLSEIDEKQFGGKTGTSTTDALVEMANMWYAATDKLDVFVRVILLDFSKAFDLINHRILIEKLHSFGIHSHILVVGMVSNGQDSKGKSPKLPVK